MPKVVITQDYYDGGFWEYTVDRFVSDDEVDPEYQVVMEMKASHFKNIQRNAKRVFADQEVLNKFFEQAKDSYTVIRET